MKLVSWNVNGIRAVQKKGFADLFKKFAAEVVCLQETKAEQEQVDTALAEGYHLVWNSALKKGYSGTAVFSKEKPLSFQSGMGVEEHDQEGRVITLEFEYYFLVNVYTPNAQNELKRLPYRLHWDADFRAYLQKLDKKKPVLCCGDLNVAH